MLEFLVDTCCNVVPEISITSSDIYIFYPGILTVATHFTLHTEPSVDPPEFSITCRSRGGPATTVEWLIDGVPVEEDSNHTTHQIIVDKSALTVYDNTLTVRGRQLGTYTCAVSNNIEDFVPVTQAPAIGSIHLQSE